MGALPALGLHRSAASPWTSTIPQRPRPPAPHSHKARLRPRAWRPSAPPVATRRQVHVALLRRSRRISRRLSATLRRRSTRLWRKASAPPLPLKFQLPSLSHPRRSSPPRPTWIWLLYSPMARSPPMAPPVVALHGRRAMQGSLVVATEVATQDSDPPVA